ELQDDLGGREGDAVELEIAQLLHLPIADGHVADDGLADVGLPDAHRENAVLRQPFLLDEAIRDDAGADGSAEAAAVAAPVYEGGVDRDLAVQVVDVVARLAAPADDHALAGAAGGAAHAVGVLAVGIGRTDHPHQQRVTRRAGHARGFGQVFQAEEHALGGAAAHVGGGDAELCDVGHGKAPGSQPAAARPAAASARWRSRPSAISV